MKKPTPPRPHWRYENVKYPRWLGRFICKRKGHDWDMYTVSTGYWSNDIEQAGYCLRCGYDTHGEYNS